MLSKKKKRFDKNKRLILLHLCLSFLVFQCQISGTLTGLTSQHTLLNHSGAVEDGPQLNTCPCSHTNGLNKDSSSDRLCSSDRPRGGRGGRGQPSPFVFFAKCHSSQFPVLSVFSTSFFVKTSQIRLTVEINERMHSKNTH